jgi:methyl-accepting chemotaxis protein
MTDLAKLVVRMEADSARLHKDLKDATKRLNSFGRRTDKVLGGVKKGFALLGGAALVGGFSALVKSTIDASDKVQKLGVRLGASVEALSEYKHVADQTGVSFETLTMGWQRMTRRVSEAAQGMGEARGALKELGVDVQALNQLSPSRQFELLTDALEGVESSSDKVRIAMKLFDSEGVALLQTMKGGTEAIKDMREQSRELGATLTDEQAAGFAAVADATGTFNTALRGAAQALAAELSPAATSTLEALTGMVKWVTGTMIPTFQRLTDTIFGTHTQLSQMSVASREFFLQKTYQDLQRTQKDLQRVSDALDTRIKIGARGRNLRGLRTQYNALSKQLVEQAERYGELYNAINTIDKPTKVVASNLDAIGAAGNKAAGGLKKAANAVEEVDKSIEGMVLDAKVSSLVTDLDEMWDGISDISSESLMKLEAELDTLTGNVKEIDPVARDLGLTFSSAFEDAIISGRSFRDVLKGIAEDIERIFLRKIVTEPLAKAVSGAASSFASSLYGNARGGLYRVGGSVGEHPVALNARAGETVAVMPTGGAGNINVTIRNEGTPQEVRRSSATVSADGIVLDVLTRDIERGGPINNLIRGSVSRG